ncbi:MAG: LysM peptidoglycan-binding domain-containing protein [Kiritimatiellae bacterium]|nr:LysM peptidoglycan-binding domain-containing protein [Kiritimatiellia bacterium]MDD5522210.1 LysM peptidoglycan-binding domain-containing protein [Kiritimatiellia bacterium]
MRTPLLVGIVVAVHCVAVGSAVLIQGCRTTHTPKAEPVVTTETTEIAKPEAVPQVVPPVVETSKPAQTLPVDTTKYVVASGDSLSVIAYKYGLKVPEIMALNNMTNPNKLRIGQKLLLPGNINLAAPKRHVVKKAKVAEAKQAEGTEGAGEYTVEPGDSLSAIAVKHGTTIAAIKKANGLTSSALQAGQKLMIPGAVQKEEKAADVKKTETLSTETTTPESMTGAPAPAAVPAAAIPAAVDVPAKAHVVAPAPAIAPATAPAGKPAAAAPVGKATVTQTYTVEPNDDLVKVSKMWGVSVDELKKLNGLADTTLKPGQVLKIPIVE